MNPRSNVEQLLTERITSLEQALKDKKISLQEYYRIINIEYQSLPKSQILQSQIFPELAGKLADWMNKQPRDQLPLHSPFRKKMDECAQYLLKAANEGKATESLAKIAHEILACKSWNDLYTVRSEVTDLRNGDNEVVKLLMTRVLSILPRDDEQGLILPAKTPVDLEIGKIKVNYFTENKPSAPTPLYVMADNLINLQEIDDRIKARLCSVYTALTESENKEDKALATKLGRYFTIELIEKYRQDNSSVMHAQVCLARLSCMETKYVDQKREVEKDLGDYLQDFSIFPSKYICSPTVTELAEKLKKTSDELKKFETISFFGRHRLRNCIDNFRDNIDKGMSFK